MDHKSTFMRKDNWRIRLCSHGIMLMVLLLLLGAGIDVVAVNLLHSRAVVLQSQIAEQRACQQNRQLLSAIYHIQCDRIDLDV